jgi:replicative DNA helicase
MLDFQRLTLAALIDSGSIKPALEANLTSEHFANYEDVWTFVEQYARRNGKAPTRQIMEARYPKLDLPSGQEQEVKALIAHLTHNWLYDRASGLLEDASRILLDDDPEAALEYLQRQARQLKSTTSLRTRDVDVLGDWSRFLQDAIGRVQASQDGQIRGISTGFKALDDRTGGLDPTELVTVVARQGEGKSWALMYMAVSAVMQGKSVCFFPLEMSEAQVGFRFHVLFQGQMNPNGALRHNGLTQGKNIDLKSYREFLERLDTEVPGKLIMCHSDRRFSPGQVIAKVEEHQPDLVVIDYLTLMALGDRELEGWSDIRILTKELKSIATEYEVPVLVAAQANRVATSRKGPPELADIAFGDAIGMDSDRVISFKKVTGRVTQGRVIKNRHGDDLQRYLWLRTEYNAGKIVEINQEQAQELIDEDRDRADG